MNDLKWGETPFDKMTRAELLREVQRMYSALMSANSALSLAGHGEMGGFWGISGTGGRAREKARQVIEPIHAAYDRDDIYRAFYRYADDLLFDGLGYGWVVCDVCGLMYGDGQNGKSHAGVACKVMALDANCTGLLRPLTWADLMPKGGE